MKEDITYPTLYMTFPVTHSNRNKDNIKPKNGYADYLYIDCRNKYFILVNISDIVLTNPMVPLINTENNEDVTLFLAVILITVVINEEVLIPYVNSNFPVIYGDKIRYYTTVTKVSAFGIVNENGKRSYTEQTTENVVDVSFV